MAESGENPMVQNRSMLKDFIASVATMSGDLSNITAPPFVLDAKSTVEIPSYWAENSTIFCSPATSDDPAERAMLVLRSFLAGIKSQCFMGHSEQEGLKKPLNAFLGELFLATWEDSNGTTRMVSEQVSHHPPITACRIWNEKYGVTAESFNRSSISLSTSVSVESTGLVLKSISKFDEHHLIPIPDFKVKSLLSTPSPELTGTYYLPSTSGFMSVVHFSESGMFNSSKAHSLVAHVYNEADGEKHPLYTFTGSWSDRFVIHDERKKQDIETFDVEKTAIGEATPMTLQPVDEQDAWESRKAWKDVISSLHKGDMKGVSTAKDKLEEGQRQMREDEESAGRAWEQLFFRSSSPTPVFNSLIAKIPKKDARDDLVYDNTIWVLDEEKWQSKKRPYHGSLSPDNSKRNTQISEPEQSQNSKQPQQIDHKIGAVEDGRPADVDGVKVDVGRQPEQRHIEGITKDEPGPQAAQVGLREEYQGSGIGGMSLEEKHAIENMLRDRYATGSTPQSK